MSIKKFSEIYNKDPEIKEFFDSLFEGWDRQTKWMIENQHHFKSTQDPAPNTSHNLPQPRPNPLE